jgi:hypothetical protein
MFALHQFFEIKKSLVLGLIVIDQDIVDEDRSGSWKYFNFIFNQVANQKE